MKIFDKIVYGWFYSTGYFLGILPLAIQHVISDIGYFLFYKVFKYRLKVVRTNLDHSFPEKTEQEKRKIERDFYEQLVDTMVESLAIVGLSEKSMRSRLRYTNPELINGMAEHRSVISMMAHCGSWEYTSGFALFSSHPVLGVYHPLTSKGADKFYFDMRTKFGAEPTTMGAIGREIARRNKDKILVALIADQSPPINKEDHWIDFLNQKTLFFRGAEMLATRYNMAVAYLSVRRVKRGFYEATFIPIYNGTDKIEPYELAKIYAEHLERDIRQNPQLWLWTHRRWKKHPGGTNIYNKKC